VRLRAHRLAGQSASTRNKPWVGPSPSARWPSSLEVVGPAEAVRQASTGWPDAVLWPTGFRVDRLRRRLAATHKIKYGERAPSPDSGEVERRLASVKAMAANQETGAP
jgi:hypothetical protein